MGRLWRLLEASQVQFRWVHRPLQAAVPRRLVPGLRVAGGGGAAQARSEEKPQPEVRGGRAGGGEGGGVGQWE